MKKLFLFSVLSFAILFFVMAHNISAENNSGNDLNIEWIKVEGGSFQMGSNLMVKEKPVHKVELDSFYISKYEVTFSQYDKFCETTGRRKPGDEGWGRGNRPVINVSWNDAKAFCDWLSKKTGQNIHLPTEAQWEYAARGGNKSKGYKYSGSNNLEEIAWFSRNSEKNTHPVGQKKPNELGIYDMTGNVREWCHDWYDEDYYSNSETKNPKGPSEGRTRVNKGGKWNDYPVSLRISYRGYATSSLGTFGIGFRIIKD